MEGIKSGVKTSEFWFAVIRQSLLVLVALGALSADEVNAFIAGLDAWVQATVYLGGVVGPLVLVVVDGWNYLKSRTGLKKAALESK